MRQTNKLFVIFLIAAQMLSNAIFSVAPAHAAQLKSKRAELEKIKAKIALNEKQKRAMQAREASILREIETNDAKLSVLTIEVQKLKVEVNQATEKREAAGEQLDETKQQLANANEKLAINERKLAYQQEILDRRLRNIYKTKPSLLFVAILEAQNITDFMERTSLVSRVAKNDAYLVAEMQQSRELIAKQVDTISQHKKTIAKRHLFLIDEETHLKIVKKRLCLKYDVFYTEQKRQQKMFAMLQKEKIKINHDQDVLESTSNMVAEQIRMLEKEGNKASSSLSGGGNADFTGGSGFMRPCSDGITSGFGYRFHPVLHYSRLHGGIDFAAPSGSKVMAAANGTVILAGWMGGYGNAVVINHGNGITTLYGHNSRLLVSVGDTVKQGQAISKSGSTGLSTGPHLHFEVRENGTPKNPMNWLR
jgi:murein DD-endopeptidase MepM/ murein hydrolase activator NlpD